MPLLAELWLDKTSHNIESLCRGTPEIVSFDAWIVIESIKLRSPPMREWDRDRK
jgi:hypothetical protein